jgi:3-mercaptopyruvate sulfurtransferase SseA
LITGLNEYPIERNEKVILYSDGGIHSAQAWFLLKARKYHGVYILRGGLEEWKDAVLFPTLAENASPEEKTAFERTKGVSKFFGGTPRTGSSQEKTSSQVVMPKLDTPAPTAVPGTAKKKKKEGC